MKKRILSLLLLAALSLTLLTACGGKKEDSAKSVDLAGFYTSITEKYETPMAEALPDDVLPTFYPGLESIALTQKVLYAPMMSAVAWEIAMVEVENSGDADKVANIFQARIDAQAAGGAWYPETVEGWVNNSRLVTNGSYVLMIVGEDCDSIVADFEALLK